MSTHSSGSQKLKNSSSKPPHRTVRHASDPVTDPTMEKSIIILPMINDGVVALGDLWDCKSNKCSGNLFNAPLGNEYLQADTRSSLDYTMHRIKRTSDIANMLKISAELKLEIPFSAGKIEIEGSASFDRSEKNTFHEENISLQYEATTYRVRVLPTSDVLVSDKMRKLLNGDADTEKIATHYVESVILGAKCAGAIAFREKFDDSKLEISGSFKVKMDIKDIIIDASAEMLLKNTEQSNEIDTTVSVKSQPRWPKAPVTCEDFFEQIKTIDALVDDETHFTHLNEKAVGVPIAFRLAPIKHLIDVEMDGLYLMLKEDLMLDFSSMIFTLQDYSSPMFIKSEIVDAEPKLIPILIDEFNPLTMEIAEYSAVLAVKAKKLKQEAALLFIEYKYQKATDVQLQEQLTRYSQEFKIEEVIAKILQYRKLGRGQLNMIRASDVNGIVDEDDQPTLNFFSNKQDLDEWYLPERTIKILLQTNLDYGSPSGVFLKLYDMSPALVKKGIEVGVAFPNISDDFSLTFKSQHDETSYNNHNDIRFMLHVMGVAVDSGDSIERAFYSVNAALSGLQLPMEDYLHDIPKMVIIMDQFRDTIICESYCDLLSKLLETDDSWNFVLPVQALYTSVEMMRFYRQLKRYIPENLPNVSHRWLVSKFNDVSEKFYSPLLLVFKDDLLQAVCLDQLDIRILIQELEKPVPDLSLISHWRMRESCLYPPRADFAASIVQNLILEHGTSITDPVPDMPDFPTNDIEPLNHALKVVASSCLRNERLVLSTVCRLTIQDYDSFEGVLKQYFWQDGQFSLDGWKQIDWAAFYSSVEEFVRGEAPFLMKVVLAIDGLKELQKVKIINNESIKLLEDDVQEPEPEPEPEEMTEEQIKAKIEGLISFLEAVPDSARSSQTYIWKGRLVDEEELYKNLRIEVSGYNSMPPLVRIMGIIRAMEKFFQEQSSKDEFFDIFQVLTLAEGLKDETIKSLKPFLTPVCRRYCDRVISLIVESEYPRAGRRLTDSLNESQLYKTVGILSEIQYNTKLYILHQEFFNISTLPAPLMAKSIIEKMNPFEFDDAQLEIIWTNPKFLYMLRQVVSNQSVLDTLWIHVKDYSEKEKNLLMEENLLIDDEEVVFDEVGNSNELIFPFFIPADIVEKIKNLVDQRTVPQFDWEKEWKDINTFVEQLQIFVTRQLIPDDFGQIQREHLEDTSNGILTALEANNCDYYWDKDEKIVYHPWSLYDMQSAIDKLMTKPTEDIRKPNKLMGGKIATIESKQSLIKSTFPDSITVNSKWSNLVETKILNTVSSQRYNKAQKRQPISRVEYESLGEVGTTVAEYICQQLKLSNAGMLFPKYVSTFINYPLAGSRPGEIDFGEGFPIRNLGLLLTRGDIQTLLCHLADSIVLQQMFQSLLKSPVAIPLIVTNIIAEPTKRDGPTQKCIFLVDALKNLIVPEFEATLPEPRLFMEPYRFVLTLRIGDTKQEPGRSSLINEYLMLDKNTFSCLEEPGKKNGKAMNRDGFLEFIHLSKTTCKTDWWDNNVLSEYSSEQRQEMILLGDLHGDALVLNSLFEVLRPYVSCFVVFWKVPNFKEYKAKKELLRSALGPGTKLLEIVLYPDDTIIQNVNPQNWLVKSEDPKLNEAKVIKIFNDAITFTKKASGTFSPEQVSTSPSLLQTFTNLGNPSKGASKALSTEAPISIEIAPPVATSESKFLIDNKIRVMTIGNINKWIQTGYTNIYNDFYAYLMACLVAENDNVQGFHHIFHELDHISRLSSKSIVERIRKLRAQIEDRFAAEKNPEEKWVLAIQEELKWSLQQLRIHTMSLPDLIRPLWGIDFSNIPEALEKAIEGYKDLIVAGFPTEIFHRTYSSTMFMNNVEETLGRIDTKASTRVFILSVIGLKDVGKSYLLNRLFGSCPGFTEHSTTFGIQMRLLWLSDQLRDETDCDAFLILDSEGVGNAENRIDPEVDALERRLISLLLGCSNLTLNVVLGGGMEEMGNIYEVAMASLTKLEKIPIVPDLCIVQNFRPEQDESSTEQLAREFDTCLQSTLTLTEERELQLGLNTRSSHTIYQVKSRNRHSELIQKMRPLVLKDEQVSSYWQSEAYRIYHNEDVASLYKKIISSAQSTRQKRITLKDWVSQSKQLWEDIQSQPLNKIYSNPSSRAAEENVLFEERINSIKKAIDAAYFYHEKKALSVFVKNLDKDFIEYEPSTNFENKLNLTLNKVLTELNKTINTCDDLATIIVKGRVSSRRKARYLAAAAVNPNSCLACEEAFTKREALFEEMLKVKRGFLVVEDLTRYMNQIKESVYQRLRQSIIARQIEEGKSTTDLKTRWEEIIKGGGTIEVKYNKYLQYISTLQFVIPARHVFHTEMIQVYKNVERVGNSHQMEGDFKPMFPNLEPMIAFDVQIYNSALESAVNSPKPEKMTWLQHDWLLSKLEDIPRKMKVDFESVLYRIGMARELQSRIQNTISLFEEYCGERILPKFQWEVHVYGILLFSKFVEEQQLNWDGSGDAENVRICNNPLAALRKRKEEFDTLFDTSFANDITSKWKF